MVDFLLEENENYAMRCGEVYWTTRGRMVFHCCLCELKFSRFDFYEQHLKDHVENFSEVEFSEKDWTAEDEAVSDFLDNDTNKTNRDQRLENVDYEDLLSGESEEIPTTNDLNIANIKAKKKFTHEIEIDKTEQDFFDLYETDSIKLYESSEYLETEFKTESEDTNSNAYEEISYAITPVVTKPILSNDEENEQQESAINSNGEKTATEKTTQKRRSRKRKHEYDDESDMFVVDIEPVREVEKRDFPRSQFIKEEERKYKCPICNLGFKERHNMRHHLLRHSDKKDHKCPKCGKAFYTPSEVTVHIRSHSKERAFLCSICGKSYVYSSHLTAHIKRHGNERNYKCEICGKSFFDKARLTDHMIDHSSVKQFACEWCNARFSRQKSLKNHEKLHENRKEFKCSLCDAAFNQRAGLFSHMKNVHNKA